MGLPESSRTHFKILPCISQSRTKATWPGLLDCLAAGGMAAGEMPMESMCKEAAEEAGVSTSLVKRIRPSGAVCYNGFDQTGWCALREKSASHTSRLPA